MMNDQHSIDDDTWLSIINGSVKADPDSQKQQQVKRIRSLMLQSREQKNLSPDELNKRYEEERYRLLAALKEKNLLDPTTEPRESILKQLNHFIFGHKALVSFAMLASLLAIVLIPLLQQSDSPSLQYTKTDLPEGMVIKGLTQLPPQTIQTNKPHEQVIEIQEKLQKAGLDVSVKQTKKGWLLETDLPLPLSEHQDVVAILKKYSIDLPLGGNHLRVLFVSD